MQSNSTNFSMAVKVLLGLTMYVELLPYNYLIKQMMERAIKPFSYIADLMDFYDFSVDYQLRKKRLNMAVNCKIRICYCFFSFEGKTMNCSQKVCFTQMSLSSAKMFLQSDEYWWREMYESLKNYQVYSALYFLSCSLVQV